MTININILTQHSNKTLTVVDLDGNLISTNYTNEVVSLPYTNSYIIYIEPTVNNLSYTGFLDLSNNIFSGFYGYIWIIIILIIFFYLFKGVKNYVK